MNILQEALDITSKARNNDYGPPDEDYGRTVATFNALTGRDLSVAEGVMFMICVKLSREVHQPKRDNRVDGAGYFHCLDVVQEATSGKEETQEEANETQAGPIATVGCTA